MNRDKDVSEAEYLSYGVLQLHDQSNSRISNLLTREVAVEQLHAIESKIYAKINELEALCQEENELQLLRQQLIQQTLSEQQ